MALVREPELHKGLFIALLDKTAPEGARQYAHDKHLPRLSVVEQQLATSKFLLDKFGVADAYLLAVLNSTAVTSIHSRAGPRRTRTPSARASGPRSLAHSPKSATST